MPARPGPHANRQRRHSSKRLPTVRSSTQRSTNELPLLRAPTRRPPTRHSLHDAGRAPGSAAAGIERGAHQRRSSDPHDTAYGTPSRMTGQGEWGSIGRSAGHFGGLPPDQLGTQRDRLTRSVPLRQGHAKDVPLNDSPGRGIGLRIGSWKDQSVLAPDDVRERRQGVPRHTAFWQIRQRSGTH